jgi:hypothetical protein
MYVLSLLLQSKRIIIQVRVSLVVSRLYLMNSALFPIVNSNPYQISLSDLSVCLSSGCGFAKSIHLVNNITFFDRKCPGGIYIYIYIYIYLHIYMYYVHSLRKQHNLR